MNGNDAERRGRLLKKARKRKGYTQEKAAELAGVSAKTIGATEKGTFANPSTLPALLDLYGLTEEHLVDAEAQTANEETGAFERFPRGVFVALLVWGSLLERMNEDEQNEKIAAVTRLLANDG